VDLVERLELCGEGRDRGRQRLRRKLGSRSITPWPGGAARRSLRSKLRQDRAALAQVGVRGSGPKRVHLGVTTTLKLEVRRQAKLHPGIRWRPLAEGGSATVGRPQGPKIGALGNRAVRWVLES
jgi:hypothetical protein